MQGDLIRNMVLIIALSHYLACSCSRSVGQIERADGQKIKQE